MNATHNRQDRLERMTSLSLKSWQSATGPDAAKSEKRHGRGDGMGTNHLRAYVSIQSCAV